MTIEGATVDDGYITCPFCKNPKAFKWTDPERGVIIIECNLCYKATEIPFKDPDILP